VRVPRSFADTAAGRAEIAGEFDVRVLVPMVTLPDDNALAREQLMQRCTRLRIASPPGLGAMIETPAAALAAQGIVRYADFPSFDTNDLTQFVFAADRKDAAVERYYGDASDVIFRLLQLTHDDVPDVSLSPCGELAGRPEHIPRLLQRGIRTYSIAAPLIPIIKVAIRNSWCSGPLDTHPLKQ